jgi:hypothetical protein
MRVSKQVTNRSKMAVIGFICVSLGSSTVQLHDSLGSRCTYAPSEAGFSSQNGGRASCVLLKISILLCLLWAKGPNAKDIHKEMFPVYGGKCCRIKGFTTGLRNSLKDVRKVADDARPGVEVAEAIVKRLSCCRFRHTGKAMRQMYQCWWRICREINAFSRFKYHVTNLLTLPRITFGEGKT